jgi:hypothetical protein
MGKLIVLISLVLGMFRFRKRVRRLRRLGDVSIGFVSSRKINIILYASVKTDIPFSGLAYCHEYMCFHKTVELVHLFGDAGNSRMSTVTLFKEQIIDKYLNANMNYGRVHLILSAGVFSNKPCADIRHAKDMNTDEIKYVLNAIKAMESIPSRIALEYSVPV